jgi:hypothetical protein
MPKVGEDVTALMGQQSESHPSSGILDTVGRTLAAYWDEINPVTQAKGLAGAVADLAGTVQGIGKKQAEPYERAKKSFAEGDYAGGAIHAVNWLIPLIGPQLDEAGQKGREGDYAGMVGKSLGIGTNLFVAPKVIGAGADMLKNARTPSLTATTPEVAAAVKAGQAAGVPVDAATATGNPVVRGAQYLADRSLGGAIVAPAAERAQVAGLKNYADALANKTAVPATTPELAGRAIQDEIQGQIDTLHHEAGTQYGTLRTIEQSNPQAMQVQMAPVKSALKPVYDELVKTMPVAQRQASRGLLAIENIVNGPDVMAASEADRALGAIKQIARDETGDSGLRSVSGGLAAKAVTQLENAVQAAVAKGGPAATDALNAGRAATKAKWAAADVLDTIRKEPVQAFNQATIAKDAGIDQLRQVARLAPNALPKVGRALLDNLFAKIGPAEGGFGKAGTALTTWDNLGPQTKALLFKDPALRQSLDQFFLLAKKMAENPNPSGTGHLVQLAAQGQGGLTMMLFHPVLGAIDLAASVGGGYGLSKLLHSPAGVKLLTEGMKLPTGSASVVANWWARAQRVAGVMGKTGGMAVPVTADQQNTTPTAP